MHVLLRSPEETAVLGRRLGAVLDAGAVVLLHGDLGAGKTCFAQGVARGLGVEGAVHSPTFVLVSEYPDARVPLRHADLYRLRHVDEARALALDERVGADGAWLIEWPERFLGLLPDDRLEVRLVHAIDAADEALRALDALATGPRHARLLAAWEQA